MTEPILATARKDILTVLKKAQKHISKGNSLRLKELSDYTISNAGIYQDTDSLSIAVIVYAISKLLERWGFDSEYSDELRELLAGAEFSLRDNKEEEYREQIKKISEFISIIEKSYRIYIEKVLEKAQVKKGSRLYEQGISAAKAASLLGIGQWELMSYVGKTNIHEDTETKFSADQRLKFARSLFEPK
jgi:hypothetical protein